MPESAEVLDPRQLHGLAVNSAGEISTAGMRPYVVNGQTYVTEVVNGIAKAIPVTNAGLLQKDEWIAFDEAVRTVQTQRRALVGDLESRGLVFNAGDLGATIAEWERSSDMEPAQVSMEGATRAEEDAELFELAGVPIPVIRKDFRVNLRRLLASRKMGQGTDVSQAQTSARLVMERSEKLLINGLSSLKVAGYTIYGYTTHPQRATHTLTAAWTDETNRDIIKDVKDMIAKAENETLHHGPFMVYVSGDYWAELRTDYKAESERTFYERITAFAEIEDVKVSDFLADGTVLLVQLTSDVVDMARAQAPMTVQWQSGDGMVSHFGILEAWAPRIKPDYNDNLGIVHGTA